MKNVRRVIPTYVLYLIRCQNNIGGWYLISRSALYCDNIIMITSKRLSQHNCTGFIVPPGRGGRKKNNETSRRSKVHLNSYVIILSVHTYTDVHRGGGWTWYTFPRPRPFLRHYFSTRLVSICTIWCITRIGIGSHNNEQFEKCCGWLEKRFYLHNKSNKKDFHIKI